MLRELHLARESISLLSTELWWSSGKSSQTCKLASFTSSMTNSVSISQDALTSLVMQLETLWEVATLVIILKERAQVAEPEMAPAGSLWYLMASKISEITKMIKELIPNSLLIGFHGKYLLFFYPLLFDRSFPDRFRVIILTRKRSKAMNHFKLRKCPLLYMGD